MNPHATIADIHKLTTDALEIAIEQRAKVNEEDDQYTVDWVSGRVDALLQVLRYIDSDSADAWRESIAVRNKQIETDREG